MLLLLLLLWLCICLLCLCCVVCCGCDCGCVFICLLCLCVSFVFKVCVSLTVYLLHPMSWTFMCALCLLLGTKLAGSYSFTSIRCGVFPLCLLPNNSSPLSPFFSSVGLISSYTQRFSSFLLFLFSFFSCNFNSNQHFSPLSSPFPFGLKSCWYPPLSPHLFLHFNFNFHLSGVCCTGSLLVYCCYAPNELAPERSFAFITVLVPVQRTEHPGTQELG